MSSNSKSAFAIPSKFKVIELELEVGLGYSFAL